MGWVRRAGALLAILCGCAGQIGGDGESEAAVDIPRSDDPDAPAPWTLHVDTTPTDSFAPPSATTWPITGQVTASEGLSTLMVADMAVPTGADGSFTREVSILPGLNLVPIEATDLASPEAHSRQAHRSILSADYLPEGHINPGAAALTLTNEVVAPMAEPLQARVATIDIASEIMARPTLTDDECVTYPDSARHGTPTLELLVDEMGELWLQVVIPNLEVRFHGHCSTFLFSTDITGKMTSHVVLRAKLFAPPGETCVAGLEHEPAVVDLVDFDMDVSGGSSLLELLIVTLAGEMKEGDTADALKTEFSAEADMLLSGELDGVTVFDTSETMNLFDTPIDVSLCLTGLVTESGTLRARVGATAAGPGGALVAPGAPQVGGVLPPSMPGRLWLDSNLVSQLVFAAWRAGALHSEGAETIDLATLTLIVPELRGQFPEGSAITIGIEGRLPPLVRAAPADSTEGDMVLDIGDLHLLLEVDGELLFRVGTQLSLTLELVPEGGALKPEVVDVQSEIWILEEPIVDADDETLASAIGLQIGEAAAALLGDAAIGLPEVGGALVPVDATTTPDGRYVEIVLE